MWLINYETSEEFCRILTVVHYQSQCQTDLADIYAYNKSAELVGEAFALEPGLREQFQIVYKVYIYI